MSDTDKPCGTCGLMNVGSNRVVITDMKKHMTSPVPCHECMERSKEHFAELGRKFARKVNDAVMDAVLRPVTKPMPERKTT